MVNVAVIDWPAGALTFETATPLSLTAIVDPDAITLLLIVTLTAVPRDPDAGLIVSTAGGGGGADGVIVNVAVAPPLFVRMARVRGPCAAETSIVTVAVTCVAVALTLPTVTPPPSIDAVVAPLTNPLPDSVTFTVLPAAALFGLSDVISGGTDTVVVAGGVVELGALGDFSQAPRNSVVKTAITKP
jgi:hypothetical protein